MREAGVWVEESGRVEGTGAGAEGIVGETNQGNGCWTPPCSAPNSWGFRGLQKGAWMGCCSRKSLTLVSGNRVGVVW